MSWLKKQDAAPPAPEQTVLVDDSEVLDCSWCASEQGKPTTASPTICDFHMAQMLQLSRDRTAQRSSKI